VLSRLKRIRYTREPYTFREFYAVTKIFISYSSGPAKSVVKLLIKIWGFSLAFTQQDYNRKTTQLIQNTNVSKENLNKHQEGH